jgi:hypothetical protein
MRDDIDDALDDFHSTGEHNKAINMVVGEFEKLNTKIDRLQAAGDGLAEHARRALRMLKEHYNSAENRASQTIIEIVENTIAKLEKMLADWEQAKQ